MSVTYNGAHSVAFITVSSSGTITVTKSWDDLFLIPASRLSVTPAQPNYSIVSIPGSNRTIDLSAQISGALTYGRRSGSWEFYIDHDMYSTWAYSQRKINDLLNGKRIVCVLMDDPSYPYSGRIILKEWKDEDTYSKITLDYDFDYTYDNSISVEDISKKLNWGSSSDSSGTAVLVRAQTKTVSPKVVSQIVQPDQILGYNYLDKVVVNPIPYKETSNSGSGTTALIACDGQSGTPSPGGSSGGTVDVAAQSKTVIPTSEDQLVTPDSGYDYLSDVLVKGVSDAPNIRVQSKMVTPTTERQLVTPDSGYDYLSNVEVKGVSAQIAKITTLKNEFFSVYPDEGYDYIERVDVDGVLAETLNITPEEAIQLFEPEDGRYFNLVIVDPIHTQKKTIVPTTEDQVVDPDEGYYLSSVTVKGVQTAAQSKTVTPTTKNQLVTPDNGYDYLDKVTIRAIPTQSKVVTPSSSTQAIYPDDGYYLSSVTVEKAADISNLSIQEKNITVSKDIIIYPDDGYDYLRKVTINVDPDNFTNYDVIFIDYDGRIVAGYTSSDFLELDALPSNPDRSGLIAQGWGRALLDAKEYVSKYRNLIIGQQYSTLDGKTRIYIHVIEERRLLKYYRVHLNGSVTIDWGDGTTPQVLSGNSTNGSALDINHVYTNSGDYIVTLTIDGEFKLDGMSGDTLPYTMYKVEIGDGLVDMVSAFNGCHGLTSIVIPDSVTSIGNNAFLDCYSLTSIVIPDSVTSIGNNAFNGCHGLTSIVIPDSVTSIGNNAFNGCHGLTSIVIPDSVTSIGNDAFSGCDRLTSIVIPDSVTSIGNNAFNGCDRLTSIVIPDSVTSIGRNAFLNCHGLTSIVIPDSVTSIGNNAFNGCHSLPSIVIPDSVTSIEGNAFNYCFSLIEIHFLSMTPPTLISNGNTFYNIDSTCIFYVPQGCLEAYKTANNWSTYANRMQEEPA